MRGALAAIALGLVTATRAAALDLPLPAGAALQLEEYDAEGRYALPAGPFDAAAGLPVQVIEGPLTARAWRVRAGLSSQQMILPIRTALESAGWTIVLDCAARECGGFDFRFATRVLPAPAMFVDLQAFRAISALGPDGAGVSVIASRDAAAGYVQVIRAGPSAGAEAAPPPPAPPVAVPPPDPSDLVARLERTGHAVLPDLAFDSGAAALMAGAVASLDVLAEYLAANPDRRVLFVGHTDATGSLAANAELSRQRAQAAVDYLAARHGLGPGRISAEGAGFLAPIATNLTPEGREANRRVEAILLPRD